MEEKINKKPEDNVESSIENWYDYRNSEMYRWITSRYYLDWEDLD